MAKMMDSFCRTCMVQLVGQTNQIITSFHIFQTDDFVHKFIQCTNLQVHPDDEYPSSVCAKCFASVLSLYDFQNMCRDSINKFSSMLVEIKLEPEISSPLGNNNSAEFLTTTANQVDVKCEQYDLPELAVVVDPLLAPTKSQLAELKLEVQEPTSTTTRKSKGSKHLSTSSKADITDLKDTTKNQQNFEDLLDQSSHVELLEEVEFDRFDLLTVAGSKENEQHMEAATCVKKDSEVKLEKNQASQNKFEEKCKTTNKDNTNISDALCSYEDNSDGLTDGELEFLSEDSESLYEEESEKIDPSKRLQCSLCPKIFIKKHILEAHMRTHQGLLEHPCPLENCNRSFRVLVSLTQHLRDHNGLPREYRCVKGDCDRIYNHYQDWLLHRVEEHGAPSLFKCDEQGCGKVFKYKSGLKQHNDQKHNEKKHNEKTHRVGRQIQPESHMCQTCGAVLRSAAKLRTHSLIHVDTSPRPYACPEGKCSKRFKKLSQLYIHLKRHDGIKNYFCPHCDMRFVTKTHLKRHLNTHTRKKTWSCEFCPKVYITRDMYNKHVRNKHGVKI